MRQFVPMTDDLLYDLGNLPGPLVPYRCGLPCWHGLQAAPSRNEDPAPRPRSEEPALSASASAGRRV